MKNRNLAWILATSTMVATSFVSAAVSAVAMEDSKNVVCAVIDVVGCTEKGACMEGTASSFDLPEFMILDSANKVIRAATESGHKSVSAVKNMERSGDHLVLQGVENSRGWNIAINTKTGRMSASGVGDAVSFLVFGACTAL
jgi:hypothetical protein